MPELAPVMRKTLSWSGMGFSPIYDELRMLYDKARIFVQGGAGGDGCLSFRREAHVPHGGPDGGDGGRGGDVVLLCDDSLRDLQSFKRWPHHKAQRGRHGEGAQRHGARGDDLVVRVPPGTQVTDWEGTEYDLVVPGTRVVIAPGGPGGRGNKRFASSTRQAVIADIPGLIEGASEGAGLGHDFLAHVERTRLLVHVLDLAPLDGSDPRRNFEVIERELAEHDPRLASLPRILALSKADLVPPAEAAG